MKYSVVIPLYNGAKTIEKTLDSVLAQTFKDYEIVMVNDGSPDNVAEVVKAYMARHPEIKFVYLEQKNKGLGGARNTAIRRATGEIIAILDQDDIWYPEKLAKVAELYENDPGAVVVCHQQYIRKNGIVVGILGEGKYEKEMHRRLLFEGNSLSTSATTFKKSAIEAAGYFSEEVSKLHFVEDYDLWLRLALKGFRFVFLRDFLGEYIIHDANYSTRSYEQMNNSELYVVNAHYSLLRDKRPFDWYLIRVRRAKSFFRTAQRIFAGEGFNFISLKYFLRMIGSDPLYFFGLLFYRVPKRLIKHLIFKGGLR